MTISAPPKKSLGLSHLGHLATCPAAKKPHGRRERGGLHCADVLVDNGLAELRNGASPLV